MTDSELIARLSADNIELRDQLAEKDNQIAEAKESSNYWYEECQKRMPVKKLSFNETVLALAHAEVPQCKIPD